MWGPESGASVLYLIRYNRSLSTSVVNIIRAQIELSNYEIKVF